MVRNVLILILLLTRLICISQDSIKKTIYPELNYKNKFTIKWPLSDFSAHDKNIFYKNNRIAYPLLKEIAEIEPNPSKKINLFNSLNKIDKKRNSFKTYLIVGFGLIATSFFVIADAGAVAMAGDYAQDRFEGQRNVSGVIFGLGLGSETMAVICQSKRKKAISIHAKLLNE